MNVIKNLFSKLLPVIACCFSLVLMLSANSASCYLLHEPKAPTSLSKFEWF